MGSYATTTAFSTFMVGVTLDSNSTALLSSCIDWAESEINKKLARRYDISSFTTTAIAPHLRTMTQQMALGYFYKNNSRGSKEAMSRGDEFLKMAMGNLDELSSGKMDLLNTAGSAIASRTTRGVLSNTDDYIPTFAEDDPLNWVIDDDKLDDIDADRD